MTAYRNWSAYVPTFATTYFGDAVVAPTGTALIAGHTRVTSPAHPFAGAIGEFVNRIDMNDILGVAIYDQRYFSDAPTAPPDFTKRWAVRCSFLHQRNSTSLTLPRVIVEGTLALGGPRDFIIKEKTDRQLELHVDGSLVATTTVALTADVWYQLEVWEVFNNPDGSARATRQWVVRAISSSSGTDWGSPNLTTQTLIDVDVSSSGLWTLSNTSMRVGEQLVAGAGALHFHTNFALGWEDADDPFGVIRVDQLVPNATGGANDWTAVTAGGVDVDESGTAAPDNATTVDQTSILAASSPDTASYDLTAPAYIASDDQPISARLAFNGMLPVPAKGVNNSMFAALSDGSTVDAHNVSIGADATWKNLICVFRNYPGSTGFTPTQLASLEAGVRATTTSAGAITFDLSTVTVWVPYVKNGEDTPGIPRTRVPPHTLNTHRPMSLSTPPAPRMIFPRTFMGLFGAVAPPAPTQNRRRQSQII